MYNDELILHLHYCDSASAWRVARRIASAVKGSRRQFAHAPQPHPCKDDALKHYALPATQGGWGAEEYDIAVLNELEQDFACKIINVDMNTQMLLDDFTKCMHYSKCRKSFPPGDIPNEIWRIMLEPQYLKPNYVPKWGLGSDGLFHECIHIKDMFKYLLAVLIATNCLPVACVVNLCFAIPKKVISCTQEHKAATATRTIHCYVAFMQCLIRVFLRQNKIQYDRNAFGAVPKRQREEAIGIQLHNIAHATQEGLSYALRLFDQTNAFYCSEWENLALWNQEFKTLAANCFEQNSSRTSFPLCRVLMAVCFFIPLLVCHLDRVVPRVFSIGITASLLTSFRKMPNKS